MRREILTPIAVTLGAALVAVSCTADGSDESGPSATAPGTEPTNPPTTAPPPTSGPTTPVSEPGSTVPGDGTDDRPHGFGSQRLNFFGDCPALLDYMQTEAGERVTPWGLDQRHLYDDVAVMERAELAVDAPADEAVSVAPADGSPQYSQTNTQEVDVDEGDVVETDGTHVYVADHDHVRIVSVSDASIVSEVEVPEGQQQMILDGDRLLVVSSAWSGASDTIVSSFDVADPGEPVLLQRTHLEGAVLATRSADGTARLVISTSLQQRLPFVQPTEFGYDEDAALAENRRIIDESEIEDWIPRWFDEAVDGSFGPMQEALDCADIAAPRDFSGLGITWISSVDMDGSSAPVGSAGIVSTGDMVYASAENLYITTHDWNWDFQPWAVVTEDDAPVNSDGTDEPVGPPPTLIHQFSLDDGPDATYVASGEVEGRLLNQFAMSEHNGDLRVATTTDAWNFGERTESTVWVMRPDGQDLEVISSVGGLGNDEQIFAVRFMGDVGYVVTFRQVDPLYVIDLSDPENPVLDGELKIPGYSAYLHPVGEGLLLGVGQDATDTGRALGTQLSLFDVSDPTNPQRIDTLGIGGWSDVEWDHKAFLYWEPDGTIVLPVSPGWNDCADGQECLADDLIGKRGGAVVAQLDGRTLVARGVINDTSDSDTGCWNPLVRSIVIDDELVMVGHERLQIVDRESLDTRDSVTWGSAEEYGCWYWD